MQTQPRRVDSRLQTYAHTHEYTPEEIPVSKHSGHTSQRFRLHLVAQSLSRDAHHSQSHLLSVISAMPSAAAVIVGEFDTVLRRDMHLRDYLRVNQRSE